MVNFLSRTLICLAQLSIAVNFTASITQIMYQNTASTNEVSMEILDLEVVDPNRLGQLFAADSINECIFTVLELHLVVQP